jgi:hypothetical protein
MLIIYKYFNRSASLTHISFRIMQVQKYEKYHFLLIFPRSAMCRDQPSSDVRDISVQLYVFQNLRSVHLGFIYLISLQSQISNASKLAFKQSSHHSPCYAQTVIRYANGNQPPSVNMKCWTPGLVRQI